MEEEKKTEHGLFKACFYTPVSYVLFLIALSFPQEPSTENIAVLNLWLGLLFEILKFENVSFRDYLEFLCFDTEKNPLRTRKNVLDFVFAMHQHVLKEQLDREQTLIFFEQLRASDCAHKTTKQSEASCVRTNQQEPFVCAILVNLVSERQSNSFVMDSTLFPEIHLSLSELEKCALESPRAFCSCVFSAKWFMLHMIASMFPLHPNAADTYRYHTFLSLFGKLLACFACRVNFASNMELVHYSPKTDLASRANLESFMHRLHDTVNIMLNKKTDITLKQTIAYFQMLAKDTTTKHMCNILIAKEAECFARFYFAQI